MSDKTGSEGCGQQLRDSGWGRRYPVSRPRPSQRRNNALESLEEYIVWGCWELKRKFRFTLTTSADPSWKASFTYEDPEPDSMVLDGILNGHHLKISLRRTDMDQFLLLNRGFNMINQTLLKR